MFIIKFNPLKDSNKCVSSILILCKTVLNMFIIKLILCKTAISVTKLNLLQDSVNYVYHQI
jgi:hypothetical protein